MRRTLSLSLIPIGADTDADIYISTKLYPVLVMIYQRNIIVYTYTMKTSRRRIFNSSIRYIIRGHIDFKHWSDVPNSRVR